MLKLYNINGWKIVMQFNYIKCKFRLNNFFECNLCVNLYINNLKHYNISLLLEIHCKKIAVQFTETHW